MVLPCVQVTAFSNSEEVDVDKVDVRPPSLSPISCPDMCLPNPVSLDISAGRQPECAWFLSKVPSDVMYIVRMMHAGGAISA